MTFECKECNRNFHHQYELILHRNDHQTVAVYNSNKENCSPECVLCGLVLINDDHLKNHVAQHVEDQKFVCGHCKKSFKTENRYIHHITDKTAHSDNQCQLCSKTLSNKRHLRNHLKLHTRETKYHCETCKKPFVRKDKLEIHEITHSTDFHCGICKETFKSKLLLSRHHLSNHNTGAVFRCNKCPKTYIKQGHLKLHSQIHDTSESHVYKNGFKCQECGKPFRTNGNLIFHMRSHMKTA